MMEEVAQEQGFSPCFFGFSVLITLIAFLCNGPVAAAYHYILGL
jgi:hypothetical protein